MKKILRFFKNWINLIVDPRRLLALVYLPKYIIHWFMYQSLDLNRLKILDSFPCLSDNLSFTPFDAHYFYQAAWLSRSIQDAFNDTLESHYDIASDIKVVGIISAFIPVTFIDFRPLNVKLSGLTCLQGDILKLGLADNSIVSLSCLHVIEHIGLGRYGDALNPLGSIFALKELQRVLKVNGKLFISVPVGREAIHFNAHRVFNPSTIIEALDSLKLISFSLVTDNGEFLYNIDIKSALNQEYGCGLFIFTKI